MHQWRQLSDSVCHQLALGAVFGATDIGPVRERNEDNFLIDSELGLVALGDGMGGHAGGAIASTTALLELRDALRTWHTQHPGTGQPALAALAGAVAAANSALYFDNVLRDAGHGGGMGTTLTALWQSPQPGRLLVAHVGDSRLYRYRAGTLTLLTRDQTLYYQALENGQLDDLPGRNLLLQAVGPSARVEAEFATLHYQAGDLYLLCSDGLHGDVPHAAIAAVLAGAGADNLGQTCAELIAEAMRHGTRDNITAVVLLCQTETACCSA
jgi:protein phosphatase